MSPLAIGIGGAQPGLPWPTAAKLTLASVSIAHDALECMYGEVYVLDKAWTSWQEAVIELGGPHTILANVPGRRGRAGWRV